MRVLAAAAAALFVFSGLVFSGTAFATPSRGVAAQEIARWTEDGRDHVVRLITVEPGGTTGWHQHDGTLYVVVEEGVLTRTLDDCTTTFVHHTGDALVEEPAHVHVGRNLGTTPTVLRVLYVNPAGTPLSQDAPNPGCPFE